MIEAICSLRLAIFCSSAYIYSIETLLFEIIVFPLELLAFAVEFMLLDVLVKVYYCIVAFE